MNDSILHAGTVLSMAGLAHAIDVNAGGSRRKDGRPTSPRTCERWCLHGRRGVKLTSWVLVSTRVTTWGYFLTFCRQLDQSRHEARQRRLDAAHGPQPRRGWERRKAAARERRQAEARRRLEEMGAR